MSQKNHSNAGLDTLVKLAFLVDEANLEEARALCVKVLEERFTSVKERIKFTKEHIKQLVPLIAKEDGLRNAVGVTKDELSSGLFPELLFLRYENYSVRQQLHKAVNLVRVSRTGFDRAVDGSFERVSDAQPDFFFNKHYEVVDINNTDLNVFCVGRFSGDWEIAGYPSSRWDRGRALTDVPRISLWKCPNSCHLHLPPEEGWGPVNPSGDFDSNPKVKVVYE